MIEKFWLKSFLVFTFALVSFTAQANSEASISMIKEKILKLAESYEGQGAAFAVRWFFGGGFLKEVYTDEDMRITFGSDNSNQVKNYIYVMSRVK